MRTSIQNFSWLFLISGIWKPNTIRDHYELDDMSLDEVHNLLKTPKLEMEQRNNSKTIYVALNEIPTKVKAEWSSYARGKAKYIESNSESSESDEDSDNYYYLLIIGFFSDRVEFQESNFLNMYVYYYYSLVYIQIMSIMPHDN